MSLYGKQVTSFISVWSTLPACWYHRLVACLSACLPACLPRVHSVTLCVCVCVCWRLMCMHEWPSVSVSTYLVYIASGHSSICLLTGQVRCAPQWPYLPSHTHVTWVARCRQVARANWIHLAGRHWRHQPITALSDPAMRHTRRHNTTATQR